MVNDTQVVLIPDQAYDRANPSAYDAAKWRWTYGVRTSAWFTSRELAFADAVISNPGVAIG